MEKKENTKLVKLITYSMDNLPTDKLLREVALDSMDQLERDEITTQQLWDLSLESVSQLKWFLEEETDKDLAKEHLHWLSENVKIMETLLNL